MSYPARKRVFKVPNAVQRTVLSNEKLEKKGS